MLKVTAIVNLGNDAILNSVNGKNVINFNAAHTEKYKNQQGQEMNKTTWINCSYWSEKTGIVAYLKKGSQVYLEGQPESKTYVDKSGATQSQLNVRVSSIQLIGGQKQNSQSGVQQIEDNKNSDNANDLINDLPF